MGTLRIGFHPNLKQNGLFFCEFTSEDGTRHCNILQADPETLEVKMETESIVLNFPQPMLMP